jgi:hypothetical protein
MITNGPTANNQLVPQPPAPPGWGNDELAKFLDMTRSNVFASFVQTPQHYAKLLDVDSAFLCICKNLTDPPDFWAPLFLLKAHSSYRAAVGLAMAGQAPEAFMVMRGCLESALYGLYINRNKHAFEIWVKRNDSEEAKRAVRKEFTVAAMWKCLKSVDEKLQDEAQTLYERTIDLGRAPECCVTRHRTEDVKGRERNALPAHVPLGRSTNAAWHDEIDSAGRSHRTWDLSARPQRPLQRSWARRETEGLATGPLTNSGP